MPSFLIKSQLNENLEQKVRQRTQDRIKPSRELELANQELNAFSYSVSMIYVRRYASSMAIAI